jgi:cell division control protein 6
MLEPTKSINSLLRSLRKGLAVSRKRSVFVDEGILDLNYIPDRLLHRGEELRLLRALFDFIITAPYEMSQRAIIVGGVGSGKTALAQGFGRELIRDAERRRVKVRYIHVNCRELRGSLFMVLRRVVKALRPEFPDRGYAANELLEILMQLLDEEDTQLLLCLDEVDALIKTEGSDGLYYLTRVQEERPEAPRRLNLLCVSKDAEVFRGLDRSTLSSLQRNVIRMSEYTRGQLSDIVLDRAEMAFRDGAIPLEVIDFVSELAASEHGDARYAIDLLWRSGKYADVSSSSQVQPDHVRKAAATLFPALRTESVMRLSLHEQLALLAVARFFRHSAETHATTGQIEEAYHVVCEEYGEKPRGHTQFWKYLNQLRWLDVVSSTLRASGKGRTQLISLPKVPAEDLEREVTRILGRG